MTTGKSKYQRLKLHETLCNYLVLENGSQFISSESVPSLNSRVHGPAYLLMIKTMFIPPDNTADSASGGSMSTISLNQLLKRSCEVNVRREDGKRLYEFNLCSTKMQSFLIQLYIQSYSTAAVMDLFSSTVQKNLLFRCFRISLVVIQKVLYVKQAKTVRSIMIIRKKDICLLL